MRRSLKSCLLCFVLLVSVQQRSDGLSVRKSPSSSAAVIVEIMDHEAKSVIANRHNAERLAAQAGYRMLVLIGIPLHIIGGMNLSRSAVSLLEKYATDISRCAEFNGGGFMLEYGIDIERIRKAWQNISTDEQTGPTSQEQPACADIIRQLENAQLKSICPET